MAPSGALAQTAHPPALGAALSHPHITTDFSEAQPELITGVHDSAQACLRELNAIHGFVYRHLGAELLWAASMPCILGDEDNIPVGRYGTSNIGLAKTVYRVGLGHRYGRLMQTVSGVHYNFSLPDTLWPAIAAERGQPLQDVQTGGYFHLIRNFRRRAWLLIYLFGASPAVCKSFVRNRPHALQTLDEGTLYLPFATSLRMGPLGYQSSAQASLHVSYNGLREYGASLRDALAKPWPAYQAIGMRDANGEYRQLGTGLLQIENEFYGTIRPKRRTRAGERPINALKTRGVEYVEVRCLDVDPFSPAGIDAEAMRFLDAFLLSCLLADSPPDSPEESARLRDNELVMVEMGRAPGLRLEGPAGAVDRNRWAHEILDECAAAAELMDSASGGRLGSQAVALQRRKVAAPELTPSARILAQLREQRLPFFHFAMRQSAAHKDHFRAHPPAPEALARFQQLAQESRQQQAQLEAADRGPGGEPFSAYVERRRLDADPA